MNVLNLHFFDREGKPLNFKYNTEDERWEGTMHFDPLSIELFDNQNIFITEVVSGSHVHPILIDTYGSGSPGTDYLTFHMEASEYEEFFLYEVLIDDTLSLPYLSPKDLVVIDNMPSGTRIPAQINIAFNPTAEEITEMTLIGKYGTTEFMRIELYGEGIDEDERMMIWTKNFGIKFNKEDALMLKDYDLTESLPDWDIINNKRKELILTKEEIFPYIGTYRGLINIIDVFGFKDTLDVKEYWLNIDKTSPYYNKYFMTDIVNMVSTGTIETVKLLSKDRDIKFSSAFQKTGFLSLVYHFTKETGEYGDDNLPDVEPTTEFKAKEIFYKMNRLSKYLKEEFLPVNVAIKDVIGQYVYYTAFVMNTWWDTCHVYNSIINQHASIEARYEINYGVRDLSVFNKQTNDNGVFVPQTSINASGVIPYSNAQQYPLSKLPELVTAMDAYYDLFTPTTHDTVNPEPDWENNYLDNSKAGCPMVFELKIEDMQIIDFRAMKINDFDVPTGGQAYYTFANVKYNDVYEIRWYVRKQGPNAFMFTRRGPIDELYRLPIFLPYAGTYNVEVVMYDFLGGASRKFENEIVVVDALRPEILALTKVPDIYSNTIRDFDMVTPIDLEDSYAYNLFPNMIKDEAAFTRLDPMLMDWNFYRNQMANAKIYNEDLSPPGFESYSDSTNSLKKYFGVNGYAYTFNKYTEALVDDLEFVRIADVIFHGQFIAGFMFDNPSSGDIIRFTRTVLHDTEDDAQGYSDYVIPAHSPFNLEGLADLMNDSDHPAVSMFTYTSTNGKIYARAKDFGNQTYHTIDFIPGSTMSPEYWSPGEYGSPRYYESPGSGSPGALISGDIFTFNQPYWLFDSDDLDELVIDYPGFDPKSMFLFAPMIDRLSGETNLADYWVDRHYIEIKDDEQFGHLPSVYGDNFLTLGNVKVFDSTFKIPKFAYVIFTVNNIVNKTDFVWYLYKHDETNPIIIVKDVSFFMWVFHETGNYDVRVKFKDSNGNESETKITNFTEVVSADDYKKYAQDWLKERTYSTLL